MQPADFKERLADMISQHARLFPELTQSKALQTLMEKNMQIIFR